MSTGVVRGRPTHTQPRLLPEGWRWVRLGDVGQFDSGGTPPKENIGYWGGHVPFVTGADITQIDISSGNARAFLTDAGLQTGKTAVCRPGTILFVTRTRVGRVGIARQTVAASQDLSPYICGPQLTPEFVCRYLMSIADRLVANCRGATIQGLTRDFIHTIEIPLPPLEEQRRIAAILNEQMAAVGRARAAAEAQLEAAKALPAAYLRAVFSSPEVQKWPKKNLGEVLTLRKEIVHPRDNPTGPATFVGLEHIETSTGRRIGSLPLEMSQLTGRKPRFYRGDIVYGYLRPYLNKVWVAEFDGLCSVDQYVYSVPDSIADTQFVAWFMRSATFLQRAPVGDAPAWLPRIRTEEVSATEINLPSLDEQRRMAALINDQMTSAERTRIAIEEELDAITRLPPALLKRAFSGAF